jgi:hypothetical protein
MLVMGLYLLGCNTVLSMQSRLTFWRKLLPSSSGSKISQARNQHETALLFPPKYQLTFHGLHGVLSQKVRLFISKDFILLSTLLPLQNWHLLPRLQVCGKNCTTGINWTCMPVTGESYSKVTENSDLPCSGGQNIFLPTGFSKYLQPLNRAHWKYFPKPDFFLLTKNITL